jgi:hypothetical protein
MNMPPSFTGTSIYSGWSDHRPSTSTWPISTRTDFGNNAIYRLTVPEVQWEHLSGLEGVNDPQSLDSFMSLTPDGPPAIMSRTGVGQIYSLHWPH